MKRKIKKINKWIYWLPRIISTLFILFLAMFSLDVFGNGYNFFETVFRLLIHNLPSIILTIILIIAWKHELVGAIGFVLGGLFYITILIINAIINSFEWYMVSWSLIIAGPAFLIGILFFINWYSKRE